MKASEFIKYQDNQRKKNWAKYFECDPDGQNLFKCITSVIKSRQWASTEGAAAQITSIFTSSSLAHHATPVSIMETNEIELTGMSKVTQQYQLISCIATVYNIQLV